ncbi:hypothetical protein GGF40_003829 [Coemansia sp. RSA 1286]|nr:hypothetical protein GGF40_003829 [Coemansia sp. RSA 1286]
MDGTHLAIAYADRYMLLERPEEQSSVPNWNYRLVSVGSEATMADELITSLYCLSIYVPQGLAKQGNHRGQSLCVAVGYSSGYFRIFSLYGHLLTTHRLHSQPLIRIRLRVPLQTKDSNYGKDRAVWHASMNENSDYEVTDDVEEMCLTYADGTIVSIDGQSLYLALRLCLNEAASAESDEPIFQYKKWAFDLNMPLVSDAVSYGPVLYRDPLLSLAKASLTSSHLLSDATARFIVAPQHGDAAFGVFMTNEDATMSYSAVDIAGKVAAKVTGAVLNIAKSYFWRSSPQPSSRVSETNRHNIAGSEDPGTMVPCSFAIRDNPRKVLDISLAPVPYNLAALTDSLGRVSLFDLESCEVVHMLKGLRGSQCAWLEMDSRRGSDGVRDDSDGASRDCCRLFIVVYAGRRGTVEIFELGSLERPVASVSVGLGWKLVQCPTQPLGGSLVVGTAGRTRRATAPSLASCMLFSENGQEASIQLVI